MKFPSAWYFLCVPNGGLAELVDALDSKSSTNVCGFESHSRYFTFDHASHWRSVFFLSILASRAFGFFLVRVDLQRELHVFAIGGGFHDAANGRGGESVATD